MGFTLRSVKKLASTTCYVKKWFYLKIAHSHFQRCFFGGPCLGPIGALQSSLLAFAEFDFGSCRVQCWHSPRSIPAGRHAELQNGYFQIRMLFLKLRLHFWEPLRFECSFENLVCAFGSPGPLSREGLGFAPCMFCFVICSPRQVRSPDPDEERPATKGADATIQREPPHDRCRPDPRPMRSGRQPSGVHPSRCLAPIQAADIPDAVLRRHKLLPALGNKGAWRCLAPA